jgi:polyisoprenoid-binding protein YceI
MRMRYRHLLFAGFAIAELASAAVAQQKAIDVRRSTFTIHVGKAGLFSAAGHEHWISAPISSGAVDETAATPSVRFAVEAARLEVRPEKTLSATDQAHVQSNMQTKVLEPSRYPEIVFQSTRVERNGGGDAWKVDGNLTLHGVTKPLTLDVRRENSAYVGTVRIRQTDFRIQPIRVGGGLVTVRDELDIRFEVYCLE